MSTKTKKPVISEESINKVEELETTLNLYQMIDDERRDAEKVQQQFKQRFAKNIAEHGDELVEQMAANQAKAEEKKAEQILFILRKSGDRNGSRPELEAMTYEKINRIYIRVKESRKSWFRRFIDFVMSWDNE
jgi:hypothetical protein